MFCLIVEFMHIPEEDAYLQKGLFYYEIAMYDEIFTPAYSFKDSWKTLQIY